MAEHTIIIDTDPGIDDAMAIFYALGAPEIDVLGVTTVFGNVSTELATENALRLLEISGRTDIPVAKGADRPLAMPFRGPADFVHGSDGQGDSHLDPPRTRPLSSRATEFIIETVSSHPGEVTLVTLGPLTNLALVLLERPETAGEVKQVVAMGGNVYCPGNASPTAEANILNDPEAADLVLQAPWQVTLCGLDVTHKIIMTPEDLDRITRVDSPEGRHLARIVPFYRAFYEAHVGRHGIYVHDSTTISYVLHPDAFQTERLSLRVDTGHGIGRGKTWSWPDGDQNVTACLGADGRRLVESEIFRFGTECVANSIDWLMLGAVVDVQRLVNAYLKALLSRDRDGAIAMVMKAVEEGLPIEDVLLSVIQPAQYELGHLWEENRITVAQEHYSSAVAQLIISRLYSRFPGAPHTKGSLVAACVDDELHEMGVRIVSDFFALAGWDTYYIGANAPARSIREAVRDIGADVVAISTTMQFHLAKTYEVIETLQSDGGESPLKIIVGGYAFNSSPELFKEIGAHGWAPNAREAVTLGERLTQRLGDSDSGD